MPSDEQRILNSTFAIVMNAPDRLTTAFHDLLSARAPALHAVLSGLRFDRGRSYVEVLTAAIVGFDSTAVAGSDLVALGRCRRAYRWEPRHDTLIGKALIAALGQALGRDFEEDARNAWTAGYVRLAEALLAATCNRMDLVA